MLLSNESTNRKQNQDYFSGRDKLQEAGGDAGPESAASAIPACQWGGQEGADVFCAFGVEKHKNDCKGKHQLPGFTPRTFW